MSDCPFKINVCFMRHLESISGCLTSSIRCPQKYQEFCVLAPKANMLEPYDVIFIE